MRVLRTLTVVGFAVAAVLVLAAAGYFWWFHPGYRPLPFSASAWAEAGAEQRGHMADDLLARHGLVGKTQAEVVVLLGEPDWARTVQDLHQRLAQHSSVQELTEKYGEPAAGRWHAASYRIGHRGFRPGAPFAFSHTLRIEFHDGIITRAYIHD